VQVGMLSDCFSSSFREIYDCTGNSETKAFCLKQLSLLLLLNYANRNILEQQLMTQTTFWWNQKVKNAIDQRK